MNQNKKMFIFLFGGMAVMVVKTVCGSVIMIALDDAAGGSLPYGGAFHAIYGAVIGAVVGGLLWGLLVYVCRDKKPPKLPPRPPSS